MPLFSIAPTPSTAIGVGYSHGTYGELLQGALADPDVDFLVTLPVSAGSIAWFHYRPWTTDVVVSPRNRRKSRTVATSILDRYGMSGGGLLTIATELPIGKGLASSSADLVATARAVGRAIGVNLTAYDIEAVLREIEPTDGVMYPGTVAFCHRDVRLLDYLGQLPPLTIVGVDEGGRLDTIAHNRTPKDFSALDRKEYRRLLDILREAVPRGDTTAIGAVSSRSAEMNQRLNPRQSLAEMRDVCLMVGGQGIVAAHSGTVLGVLLDERDTQYRGKLTDAMNSCAALGGTVHVYQSAWPFVARARSNMAVRPPGALGPKAQPQG